MINISCSVINNLTKNVDDKLGMMCTVKDEETDVGAFNIIYKSVNGENKIDFQFDKEMIGKFIASNLKLDSIIGGLL